MDAPAQINAPQLFLTSHTQVLIEQTQKTSEKDKKMGKKWVKNSSFVHLGSLVPSGCLSARRERLFRTTWYRVEDHLFL